MVEQTGFRLLEFQLFPLFHTVRIRGGASENGTLLRIFDLMRPGGSRICRIRKSDNLKMSLTGGVLLNRFHLNVLVFTYFRYT